MTGKGKALAIVLVLFGTAFCGKDSNTMTAPVVAQPMASVAGTWTGTFASQDPTCPSGPMTVTFTQNGNQVTGNWVSTACGPHGFVKATLSGNSLTGNIDMGGCTGGGIMGQVQGTSLSVAVGDFYKPLVTENQVLMQGGQATLSR